eukprot:TRINITY_DN80220_c0_g1_i1.p1 TRINITY_DN80220_c0_g1~~TRINITY_DN80220_c0_g1_i1.p1  ORF type:complete len:395 (-),score=83.91 TRINITY_DN80220_c0_g1_i1:198-1382(-)
MPVFGGDFLKTENYDDPCELGEDQGLLGPDMEFGAAGPANDDRIRGSQTAFNQARYSDRPLQQHELLPDISSQGEGRQRASRKDWAIFALGVAALVACVFASVAVFRPRAESADVTSVGEKDALTAGIGVASTVISGMKKLADTSSDVSKMMKDLKSEEDSYKAVAGATIGDDKVADMKPEDAAKLQAATDEQEKKAESKLIPSNGMNDGNICNDDEELFGALCYKKCADLTGGSHSLRNGPNSCCSAKTFLECDLAHVKMTHIPCGGFEVSGDREVRSACPNPPGSCLSNEEVFGGLCYKRCKFLTGGLYPFRSGPDSCCKISPVKNSLACFFGPLNHMAENDVLFDVGGGAGDGDKINTPDYPHVPNALLAEATTTPKPLPTIPPPTTPKKK